jgi:hypothetical protein
MEKIDQIIKLVREDVASVTNAANAPGESGAYGENSPKEGPTAGYSRPMFSLPLRRNGKLDKRNPFIKKYKVLLASLGLVKNK